MKILFPHVPPNTILKAIENTANPINDYKYFGKLGAGFINIKESYNYLKYPDYAMSHFNSSLPKGIIDFNNHEKKGFYSVTIKPDGAYKGIQFKKLGITDNAGKSTVKIYADDTTLSSQFLLSQMPEKIFVPGSKARFDLSLKNASKKLFFDIAYEAETIDSSKLYCSNTRIYELTEGVISDGSGKNNYSGLNDCKWIIKAPKTKRIQIDFDEMNTQANVDYVYLFDGERAIPEYTIAQFSGNNIPPGVISRTNTVLIWFVTDDKISGKGWQLRYKFVD